MQMNAAVAAKHRKLSVHESMTFGDWLRNKLNEARLSNAELARRVGVSSTHISNLVRDFSPSRKAPGPSRPGEILVRSIAKALDVDEDEARLAAGYAPKQAVHMIDIGDKAQVKLADRNLSEDDQKEIADELSLAYEVIMARRRARQTQNEQ